MLLLDRGTVEVDLKLVYRNFRVNSSHVLVGLSKAIVVLFEELDMCKAEFGAEACSNLDLMVRVVGMDADIVKFIYTQLIGLWMLSRGRL